MSDRNEHLAVLLDKFKNLPIKDRQAVESHLSREEMDLLRLELFSKGGSLRIGDVQPARLNTSFLSPWLAKHIVGSLDSSDNELDTMGAGIAMKVQEVLPIVISEFNSHKSVRQTVVSKKPTKKLASVFSLKRIGSS